MSKDQPIRLCANCGQETPREECYVTDEGLFCERCTDKLFPTVVSAPLPTITKG